MIILKKVFTKLGVVALTLSIALCTVSCRQSKTSNGELTVVTVWTGNTHNKSFMEQMVDKWNNSTGKEKGIKIDYTVQQGDINEKVNLAFTNHQAPDIVRGGTMIEQIENNQIIALENMPGGPEMIERFKPYLAEEAHTYKGKTYSLPFSVYTSGLLYNKDMFKAAGIVDENGEAKPPKTLKEFREDAKKLTNVSKKEYGIIFAGKYGGFYGDDVSALAARSCGFFHFNPKTGKYDYSYEAEVMKTLMGIKEDGSCFPGTESMENDPARARFGSGGIGMKSAISYDYAVLTDQFPATIDWGVAPFPVIDENHQYKTYMFCDGYLKINRESAEKGDKEKIMEVYKFLYSDDMMIESYKRGFDIPVDWNLIKDIELPDKMSGWRDFASLQQNSFNQGPAIQTDMTGETSLQEIWMNKIWTGKIPVSEIDNVCREYTDKSNEGIEKYKKSHPDYSTEGLINPSWDASAK